MASLIWDSKGRQTCTMGFIKKRHAIIWVRVSLAVYVSVYYGCDCLYTQNRALLVSLELLSFQRAPCVFAFSVFEKADKTYDRIKLPESEIIQKGIGGEG